MITNSFIQLICTALKQHDLSARAYGKLANGDTAILQGQLLVSPTAKNNKIQFVLSFDTSQLPDSAKKIRITSIKIRKQDSVLVDESVQFVLSAGANIAQVIKMTITIS